MMNDPIRQSKSCHEEKAIDMSAFKQRLAERALVEGAGGGRSRILPRKLRWSTVAAIVALFLIVGTYPTLADFLNSLYNNRLDLGVATAVEKGYSNLVDQSVTDQGITLHIVDALVDSTRLVVSYEVMRNGERDTDLIFGDFQLHDLQGNKVVDSSNLNPEISYPSDDYTYLNFDLPSIHADQVILTMNINRIQYHIPNVQDPKKSLASMKGNWNIKIPIDLSKSKRNTRELTLQQQYTTPLGTTLTLRDFTFSPSMTRFRVDSSNRYIHNYGYRIEDSNGKYIMQHDAYSSFTNNDSISSRSQTDPSDPTRRQYISNIIPLEAGDDYKIIFDGMWKIEPFSLAFNLDKHVSKEKPLTQTYDGTTFNITKFAIMKDPDRTGNLAVIQLDCEHPPIPWYPSWVLEDENGNQYSHTYPKGSYEQVYYKSRTHRDIELDLTLHFAGIPEGQHKFKLILQDYPRYEALDWSIPFTVPTK